MGIVDIIQLFWLTTSSFHIHFRPKIFGKLRIVGQSKSDSDIIAQKLHIFRQPL